MESPALIEHGIAAAADKIDAEYQSLPHATTCRHTLRLPPYQKKATLEKKLTMAMAQCQEGFSLS